MSSGLGLGIVTPVLSLRPGGHAEWEKSGTIDDVREIAQAADRLGYEYLTCSEHIALPAESAAVSGVRYWDPLATFGYLAGFTARIRFTTTVLVLGYHHPLEIAKRYGTLDQICGGRLILGVGVGYVEQEFDLLGVPFADRGPRGDDALRAVRASFGRREPAYSGPHYQFDGLIVDPCAVADHTPIWVGGRSRRSLRRAVELADGWVPFAVSPDQVRDWLDTAAQTPAWQERDRPLEVSLVSEPPLDPLGEREHAAQVARTLRDAGATRLQLRFTHRSLAHYLEQLEAMVEVVQAL